MVQPNDDANHASSNEQRYYTSFPGALYILPSDEPERQRLETQHWLLKRLSGNKLLHAPVSFEENDKILDSGTGTGRWLLDLVNEVSSNVTFHGIDVEPRMFPKEHPDTMTFSQRSIFSLPTEWNDTFKLIHQRLLMGSLRRNDWPAVLRDYYRILKPGGWVQLCEYGERIGGPVTDKMMEIWSALYAHLDLHPDCAYRLRDMLEEIGFVHVHVEEYEEPFGKWAGRDGIEGSNNYTSIWKGVKGPVLEAGGFGYINSGEEHDEIADLLEKEWDSTPGSHIQFLIVYAQKP